MGEFIKVNFISVNEHIKKNVPYLWTALFGFEQCFLGTTLQNEMIRWH